MKSDAVYALSKGTSQHSAMPVQATTPPCPHVANVPPKRNNYFLTVPLKLFFQLLLDITQRRKPARHCETRRGSYAILHRSRNHCQNGQPCSPTTLRPHIGIRGPRRSPSPIKPKVGRSWWSASGRNTGFQDHGMAGSPACQAYGAPCGSLCHRFVAVSIS